MSFDGKQENSIAGWVFDLINHRSRRRIWLSPSHGIGNRSEEMRWGLWKAQTEAKKLCLIFQVRLPKPFPVQANNNFFTSTMKMLRSTWGWSMKLNPIRHRP